MKQLGLRPNKFPGKRNIHPKRGFRNWWEFNAKNGKARDKRLWSRLVSETVEEMPDDWLFVELGSDYWDF